MGFLSWFGKLGKKSYPRFITNIHNLVDMLLDVEQIIKWTESLDDEQKENQYLAANVAVAKKTGRIQQSSLLKSINLKVEDSETCGRRIVYYPHGVTVKTTATILTQDGTFVFEFLNTQKYYHNYETPTFKIYWCDDKVGINELLYERHCYEWDLQDKYGSEKEGWIDGVYESQVFKTLREHLTILKIEIDTALLNQHKVFLEKQSKMEFDKQLEKASNTAKLDGMFKQR